VLLGNGDGTFLAPWVPNLGLHSSVAAGDFNGDGRLDLAGPSGPPGNPNNVGVMLGNGDGTFQAPRDVALGWSPPLVAVGYVNRAGRPALAVPPPGPPRFWSVHLGNGDGTLQTAPISPAGTGLGVASGDFNGDGGQDLVTGAVILLGNGDGTFQTARPLPAGGDAKAVGDFNGDGRLDLATASGGNNVSGLFGNGHGPFRLAGSFAVGISPVSVAAGDFNGDGCLDLATANFGTAPFDNGSVSVLLGNGDGSFQAARSFLNGFSPTSVAVRDFNGDGRLDLA